MSILRLALAQHGSRVGDINANRSRIAATTAAAQADGAQLVVFPELALCGQPAQDLLLRDDFLKACDAALLALADDGNAAAIVLGHPLQAGGMRYNGASVVRDGHATLLARKQQLDAVTLDEARWFKPGAAQPPTDIGGIRVAVLIGNDIDTPQPAAAARAAGAQLLLIIAATPFHEHAREQRRQLLLQRNGETGLPIVWLNSAGGHDDLVFDGGALLVNADGQVAAEAIFNDGLLLADFDVASGTFAPLEWPRPATDTRALLWTALRRALHDYVVDNGFGRVILGLSGGIDSALTLALATDALGADRVDALMLPSRHTSQLSLDLAAEQAGLLGVNYRVMPIDAPVAALEASLHPAFDGLAADITEENLQARCRGTMLMAWSNKFGPLLLSCSNKSEAAVGYSTLYGDMCGGYAPLKDVYKTRIWDLARWRNEQGPAIPPAVIERLPTAELREGQTDQQSLPPYAVLDEVLRGLIDHDRPVSGLVADGHEPTMVKRIARLLMTSEFKRQQSAPGPKVTARALSRERRYPVSHAWAG